MSHPEYVFDTKHDRYPLAVHVFLVAAAGRILLMRRAGSDYAGIWTVETKCAL